MMDKEELIRLFKRHMSVERGASPKTLEAYERDIRDLDAFLCEDGEYALTEVTTDDARAYARYLRERRGLAKSSIERHICALRSFYKYLFMAGLVKDNPFHNVALPKKEKKTPRFLSQQEAAALVEEPAADKLTDLRDRALLELLYGCGLRISEAVSLNIKDVSFSRMVVFVLGKGDKPRVQPLGEYAAAALEKYLAARKKRGMAAEAADPLFLGERGGRLNDRVARRMVDQRMKAAGESKHISPMICGTALPPTCWKTEPKS